MKYASMKSLLRRSVPVAAMLALVAGSASAATYNLRAGTADVNYGTVAAPNNVTVWGYELIDADVDGDGTFETPGSGGVMVPGPVIYVPAGQDLTINLDNGLADSTSIVVQGQALRGAPSFVGGRVTSFTDEAAAGGSVGYTWLASELKPGTYLYSSGSHPAKQVHMGLYGAMVVDADATGCASGLAAYDGICYDRDLVVVYSEVDPALHGSAGAAQALNYKPKYFLVNGDPTGGSVLTDATPASLNSRVLLRFVNAGLKSYSPTLLGEDLDWVAEDGNTYPHVRRSYGALLAAGKTMDAIWVPATWDRHALYDRRLHMSSNGYPNGGLRAFLDSANDMLPQADAGTDQLHVDMFQVDGVTPTTIQLTGGPATGVTYQWALVAFPSGSTASLSDATAANPTFTLDVPGTYTAQLVVDDGTTFSAPDSVSIFTNLPPIASAGADQAADTGAAVTLDGSASYDPDTAAHGDTVSFAWSFVSFPAGAAPVLTGADTAMPSFTADATAEGDYVLSLEVSDGELSDTDSITVTAAAHVNEPPIAGDDFFEVVWKTVDNPLLVLVNDSDGDGMIMPDSLAIVTNPMAGASAVPVLDGTGTILYTPKNGFKGTDYFTYQICDDGGECSEAQVLVNVVK